MDQTNPTNPDLAADGALGIREAAAWLGISRSTLYELLAEDGIETLRIGNKRLVPMAALRAYLAKRIADSRTEPPRPRRGRRAA